MTKVEAVVIRELEDRAVHDHLAIRVADGAVAHLADLERRHVVGEQRVCERQRVSALHVPLAQRRFVPDVGRVTRGLVLGDGVAEMVGPGPTFPVSPLGAELILHVIEGTSRERRHPAPFRGRIRPGP